MVEGSSGGGERRRVATGGGQSKRGLRGEKAAEAICQMGDGDDEDHGFPIYHRTSSCCTLPENHSSRSFIHQLDHSWFRDNIVKALTFRFCLPFRLPSPPRQCPSSPQREPFRSIELTQFSNNDASKLGKSVASEFPCAHFKKLQRHHNLEKASENSSAHPSGHRRPRKPLGKLRITVPRKLVSDNPFWEGTISDPGRTLRIGLVDLPAKACESPFQKGKLQTIASGKHLVEALTDSLPQEISVKRRSRKEKRRSSKSMTDLEVDELKGVMDLGFHFSKDNLTPRVVNMFPALQRQLRGQVEGDKSPNVTSLENKPIWSDSWWVERSASPLLNWRVPAQAEGSEDMKEHLKFWARAVASTVRQEC